MPGIAGVFNKYPEEKWPTVIRSMIATMEHEVWYKSGIHKCEKMSVVIGWINHGGDFSDCMPIFNESRDLVLFISGEVFSNFDIIQHLKSRGHKFSDGDASYLIHLYEERRDDFFFGAEWMVFWSSFRLSPKEMFSFQ